MAQKVMYVVGTEVETLLDGAGKDFFTVPTDGPEFHTPRLPMYYRDTRWNMFMGRYSNIFTSTHDPNGATKYENYEDAVKWNEEFLRGEGVIYRF
jgi:hypothetical protein